MISLNKPEAEKASENFRLKALLLGVVPEKRKNWVEYKRKRYRTYVSMTPSILSLFDSKEEAICLLRLVVLIEVISLEFHSLFDLIEAEFEELIKYYPIFGTYFYTAKVGGTIRSGVTAIV